MDPRALVRPLEARWESVLDAVLGGLSPRFSTKDVARLAPRVEALSRAYNAGEAEGRRTKLPLEARIAFSFPRDVPKGAAAVRELVATNELTLSADRPLRILDLGAGLGAMTWGIVRALAAAGATGRVDATLVDEDPEILHEATAIASAARAAFGTEPVDLHVTTHTDALASFAERAGAYDVVIVGQVLSEVDPRGEPAERIERQATLLDRLLDVLAPGGFVVVVEPALRDRTRHLHAVRDRLLERASDRTAVVAPCLHAARCPALADRDDWCHEDLSVDLPGWVAPLARAAGLRWQGLTFSYLVLQRGSRSRASAPGTLRFRAISDLLRTKGKAELFICAEDGTKQRIRRLDRDAGAENGAAFGDLRRGDVVTLRGSPADGQAPVDERGRVKTTVAIDVGPVRQ